MGVLVTDRPTLDVTALTLDELVALVQAARPALPAYFTKTEAAEYARYSVRTIERAMEDGKLRYCGGEGLGIRIRPAWVDEWLEGRGNGGSAAGD